MTLYIGMKLSNEPSPHFGGHRPSNDDMDNKSDGSSRNPLGGFHQDEVVITVRLLKTFFN